MVLMHVMNALFNGEEASDVMMLLLVGSMVFNENIHDDNVGEMSLLFCVLKLCLRDFEYVKLYFTVNKWLELKYASTLMLWEDLSLY